MSSIISNHGHILYRKCDCRSKTGNDLQLLNTDNVTNYGFMMTGKCTGEANPQTLKVKTFINHGTLVLHKCHCNSPFLEIIDLFNYGTVINCLSSCKLTKKCDLKAIEVAEYRAHMESKEISVPVQKSLDTPLDLSASNSLVSCPEETTQDFDLPKECNESLDVSLNAQNLETQKECSGLPKKTLKVPKEPVQTTENLPKKLRVYTVSEAIKQSTPQEEALPVQKPHAPQMCPRCVKSFQSYVNDPKNAPMLPKITKFKCPHCLNTKANKMEYQAHTAICQQEPKPYKCLGCRYKSTKSSSVNGHSATCFLLHAVKYYQSFCLTSKHCSN
ncbi:uncharacterized protein LOC6552694 [Drosophila erecta]|uniref:GG21512 n=1 Tax=Drosophila erecta TaxID=7220 RepID=B3P0L4_DROER|nr:uncharacterized protein LOC6552694 [Drosophila erecta]EDV48840.1 uncharacterized protein Dere_GG21512 [Drosophila erecta]